MDSNFHTYYRRRSCFSRVAIFCLPQCDFMEKNSFKKVGFGERISPILANGREIFPAASGFKYTIIEIKKQKTLI